jgi:hypothetical protein
MDFGKRVKEYAEMPMPRFLMMDLLKDYKRTNPGRFGYFKVGAFLLANYPRAHITFPWKALYPLGVNC